MRASPALPPCAGQSNRPQAPPRSFYPPAYTKYSPERHSRRWSSGERNTDNAWIVEVLEAPGLIEGVARSRGVAVQGVSRPDALQARYATENLIEGRLLHLLSSLDRPSKGEIWLGETRIDTLKIPAQLGWSLAGHLATDYDLAPFILRAVLEPSVRLAEVSLEPGVTEAYALTTQGDVNISVGVERPPLETARLSVPYSVEPVGQRGLRRGVPGARLRYYLDDWRLHGAVFQAGTGSLMPLVSVRRGFGSFELEAHALYADTLVASVGGSGLVGDFVLYGEAWFLTGALEVRGALGLTGNLDRGMWALEAAYLSPGNAPVSNQAERDLTVQPSLAVGPRPVLNGQLALPLGEQGHHSLTFTASALFDPDAPRARVAGGYSALSDDRSFTVNVGGAFGPEPITLSVSSGVRQFF